MAIASQSGDNTVPNLLLLRPDAVAVNHELKKIAILEHCRQYDSVEGDRPWQPTFAPTNHPIVGRGCKLGGT